MNPDPEELKDIVRGARRALIPLHLSPDGDSMGSSLAMACICRHLGTDVVVTSADPPPERYRFLSGWDDIVSPSQLEGEFDLLILLDCASPERIGAVGELLGGAHPYTITIDHHKGAERFADWQWVDSGASAVAKMVYDWLKAAGLPISRELALNLYVGLATDTGFFAYANTTGDSFRCAAELVDRGADPYLVYSAVNESRPLPEVKILGRALNSLSVLEDGKIVVGELLKEDFRECCATPENTEGIISHLRSINGIEVAVLLMEVAEREVKVSLRSRSAVDVSEVARSIGGGGHANAAGATVRDRTPAEVRRQVLCRLRPQLNGRRR